MLSVSFGSALSIGNDVGSSVAAEVATDAAGNSYLTGSFSGTVDFDAAATHAGDSDILASRGSGDAFVAKYAPNDSLVWAKRMGGDAVSPYTTDVGRKVAIDGSGNVYLVGEFYDSADFGSTILSSAGDKDGFVAKLNASGTVQWVHQCGAAGGDSAGGVGVDAAGNVYALRLSYYEDTYAVHKFKPNGAGVWTQSIVTHGRFSANLAVDASGNVFMGGDFHGTVDFDPGPKTKFVSSSVSSYHGFVLKLTTAGKFDWVSPFLGQFNGSTTGNSYILGIARDGSGNVIVGGGYGGPVDFNPGSGTTILPTNGGFITKLNSSGGLVWARALEGSGVTAVSALDVDSAGEIYSTGYFYGTVDLDPGAGSYSRTSVPGTVATYTDAFVVKLTSPGTFSWAETFGGSGSDVGSGIAVDTTGDVHIAGSYTGTVDFDPDPLTTYNLTTPGTFKNAFRLRLRQA